MYSLDILWPSFLNGLTTGAIYALVALGLTLIYGVLHIINFAHGAALMMALYGVYFLFTRLGIDPYLALPVMVPAMFAAGYILYRWIIGRAGGGRDENILLVTLGVAIVLENLALLFFTSDTRTIDTSYTLATVDLLGATISVPKVIAMAGALIAAALLWVLTRRSSLGRAIRACAKERHGARLAGIVVERVFALSFGIAIMAGPMATVARV